MKLPNIKLKTKNLKFKTLLPIIFLFSILGFTFAKASAQEIQRAYTVINPSIEQKLNPGGYTQGTTKVINDSSVPLTFNLGVQDYIVQDTIGTPSILPPNTLSNKYSAAAWIGVSPSVFTLKPGQKQVVNYYIQVPITAKPGGHYAAIVYQPANPNTDKNASGGIVNSQIGSLFYITVAGPVKEDAVVSKFFTNAFQEYGPVTILSQIKNNGDLHIAPKGTVKVTGLLFSQTQPLPDHNIFPEAARDFQNTFGGMFMLGRYKAELIGSYGANNNLPLTATLYFWVFPWRLALLIVLITVAVILGTKYYKKRKGTGSKGSHTATKADEELAVEAENAQTS